MKTLMIHHINQHILNIDLNQFDIITFDDALVSQFNHIKHFAKFNIPLIFFVSTNIICPLHQQQSDELVSSHQAHLNFHQHNDASNFMNWNQIKLLSNMYNVSIGGHSHYHSILNSINDNINDSSLMFNAFDNHNIYINYYAFPYNHNYIKRKLSVLKYYPNIKFFSDDRIDANLL